MDTQEQNKKLISMTEKKKVFKMTKNIKQPEILKENDNDLLENRKQQIVFGDWNNVDEVASDLWSSIHRSLLDSSGPFFAYKNTRAGSDLIQIVVVMNYNQMGSLITGDFGIGMVTNGYSVLLPHVPTDYLTKVLINDLEKFKIEKNILETFKQLILDYNEKYDKDNSNINNK